MRILLFLSLLLISGLAFLPKTGVPAQRTLTIVFHNRVGSEPLELGTPVRTILGDTIKVDRFRYYVSHFSWEDARGISYPWPARYFLIDQEDTSTLRITLTMPEGKPQQLSFLLGVDSLRNVSGVQTGALDPLHGMFWTWNSGYVMAKLEGSCEAVQAAGNRFTFHVGGFKNGMNVLKRIHLPLPATSGDLQEIHIQADINRWFKGNTELRVAETPVCHSPGPLALRIADNYKDMFSIHSVR